MAIVGGFDIHRQITFDYLDTVTGQVRRGRIEPACRAVLAGWLEQRFAGRDDVTFAVEGCTGWLFVVQELQRAGITALLAEPAQTADLRGRRQHAKTDKTDSLRAVTWRAAVPNVVDDRPADILQQRQLHPAAGLGLHHRQGTRWAPVIARQRSWADSTSLNTIARAAAGLPAQMGYVWHLRLRMAERGMYQTSDLVPLWAGRGVHCPVNRSFAWSPALRSA